MQLLVSSCSNHWALTAFMAEKQILIIGYTWPEPTTTAAGGRMMQLI
ncbi:MAG: hypothetical protein WBM77_04960 [Maribacter sp.]